MRIRQDDAGGGGKKRETCAHPKKRETCVHHTLFRVPFNTREDHAIANIRIIRTYMLYNSLLP
jgi:hypothetical protein